MAVRKNAALFLSDGTRVQFVKITSRGNFQVRVPADHPLGAADPLRIFDPATGRSTKNSTDLTLTNTAGGTASDVTLRNVGAAPGTPIDVNLPLVLSDGTLVTYVKTTPKYGFIQVRLPDSHAFAAGQENGRLFKPDGSRPPRINRKNPTDLTLANGEGAAVNEDSAFELASTDGSILADGFDSFDAASSAAAQYLAGSNPVNIVQVTRKVVGSVGMTVNRLS